MILYSAYEVKNAAYLKAFESKEDWRFPFMNILFVMEVFTFLYYANEESDDLIGGSSKTVEHVI